MTPGNSKPVLCSRKQLEALWIAAFVLELAGAFMPVPVVRYPFSMIDAFIHLALFTILTFVPMICMKCRKRTLLFSLSMAPLGYLLELLHGAITGESFSAVNVLSKNIGLLAGIATGLIVRLIVRNERCFSKTEETRQPGNPFDLSGSQQTE